jgi:nitrous oxide reductase accessory protein NosL
MYTIAARPARRYLLSAIIGTLALSGCAAREHVDLPAPINIPDISVPDVSPRDTTFPVSGDLAARSTGATSMR